MTNNPYEWMIELEGKMVGIACYKKCGFTQESVIENSLYLEGQYYSDILMSITVDAYNKYSCSEKTIYS